MDWDWFCEFLAAILAIMALFFFRVFADNVSPINPYLEAHEHAVFKIVCACNEAGPCEAGAYIGGPYEYQRESR
jgi:hypothetical protein